MEDSKLENLKIREYLDIKKKLRIKSNFLYNLSKDLNLFVNDDTFIFLTKKIRLNLLKEVKLEQSSIDLQIKGIDSLVDLIRSDCDHKFIPDGNDSHKDHYVCTICGETESV